MEYKDDDDVVVAESADAEINVHIYGSAVELENLLKKGSINEFIAVLGVERGYPDCDQISLLRESGNVSKGKNFFLQYQFVIIILYRSQQETVL